LREPKYLKTWLVRILINECLKIIRINKKELNTDVFPESSQSFQEDSIHLRLAIENLPEDLKKVITLRYFGGFTIAETAEILGIPDGTVSTRSRKALEMLRIEISD
jgi:RNA polymerase sigma-70 factor (ECF subfamily)